MTLHVFVFCRGSTICYFFCQLIQCCQKLVRHVRRPIISPNTHNTNKPNPFNIKTALRQTVFDKLIPAIVVVDAWMNKQIKSNKSVSAELAWLVKETQTKYASSGFSHNELFIFLKAYWKFLGDASVFLGFLSLEHCNVLNSTNASKEPLSIFPMFSNVVFVICLGTQHTAWKCPCQWPWRRVTRGNASAARFAIWRKLR